ncbi:rod-binding protein [Maritimibacter dapengensis]|uniref:Rod-binding protein n=1 Tax=Maritimibacter dapengensis TaxID=2836868 RepID=A0ABS6T5F4_9RHOB|nr:rod-binding protein [Maritimibacter dapengensis]MBV7380420.1 rod-binding protein [Maritimibacter dapengensis]
MDPIFPTVPLLAPTGSETADVDARLRATAKELEASFLAEMLKSAGLGEMPSAFGGGPGEEQFTSFLRLEQARQMTESGGIGLAETIFEALKERNDGAV